MTGEGCCRLHLPSPPGAPPIPSSPPAPCPPPSLLHKQLSGHPLPCLPGVRANTFCGQTEVSPTVAFSSSLLRHSSALGFPPTSLDAPSQSQSWFFLKCWRSSLSSYTSPAARPLRAWTATHRPCVSYPDGHLHFRVACFQLAVLHLLVRHRHFKLSAAQTH